MQDSHRQLTYILIAVFTLLQLVIFLIHIKEVEILTSISNIIKMLMNLLVDMDMI